MVRPPVLVNAGSAYATGGSVSGQPKGGGSSVDTFGFNLSGGADDYAVTVGELDSAYEEFADAETVDVNLIMGGTTLLVQMVQLMRLI